MSVNSRLVGDIYVCLNSRKIWIHLFHSEVISKTYFRCIFSCSMLLWNWPNPVRKHENILGNVWKLSRIGETLVHICMCISIQIFEFHWHLQKKRLVSGQQTVKMRFRKHDVCLCTTSTWIRSDIVSVECTPDAWSPVIVKVENSKWKKRQQHKMCWD